MLLLRILTVAILKMQMRKDPRNYCESGYASKALASDPDAFPDPLKILINDERKLKKKMIN